MLTKLPALFPWKHNKTKIMAEQLQTMEEGTFLNIFFRINVERFIVASFFVNTNVVYA